MLGNAGARPRKAIVNLFESPESYFHDADLTQGDRMEFSAGLFLPAFQQLLFYQVDDEGSHRRTMIHEAFHEYLNAVHPGETPPWFNEGMAEFVSIMKIEGDDVTQFGELLPERVYELRRALKKGFTGVPFPLILREFQEQFMRLDPSLQYAQAWSMVPFFMNKTNDRYWPVFDAHFRGILEGHPPEAVYATTFGRVDVAELQRAWLARGFDDQRSRKREPTPPPPPAPRSSSPCSAGSSSRRRRHGSGRA